MKKHQFLGHRQDPPAGQARNESSRQLVDEVPILNKPFIRHWPNKLECLSLAIFFQPELMFASQGPYSHHFIFFVTYEYSN